ncbi:MAG: hypothetical protein H8D45_30405 [Bacteroidetes bacterium]|nr:hypothetical protein [Bacteroidota bacterium]
MKKDITFHYTNEQMVKDLMKLIPFEKDDIVLDAGSGKNKVWQKNCPVKCLECEIEDGCDFFKWKQRVDWVIGNPSYHQSWQFTEKAISITNKGIGWLVNNQALNSHLTPRRLDLLKKNGFQYTKIHIVADKRWFGRYYFILLEKKKGVLSWERKTY